MKFETLEWAITLSKYRNLPFTNPSEIIPRPMYIPSLNLIRLKIQVIERKQSARELQTERRTQDESTDGHSYIQWENVISCHKRGADIKFACKRRILLVGLLRLERYLLNTLINEQNSVWQAFRVITSYEQDRLSLLLSQQTEFLNG